MSNKRIAVRVRIQSSIFMLFLIVCTSKMYGSICDNRYLPFIPVTYTATESRAPYTNINFVAFSGSKAAAPCRFIEQDSGDTSSKFITRKNNDKEVGIPEVHGTLNIGNLGKSIQSVFGIANPINPAWQYWGDFIIHQESHIQGQGFELDTYWPIFNHFGLGANTTLFSLAIMHSMYPNKDTIDKLQLEQTGNRLQYQADQREIFDILNLQSGGLRQIGMTDIDVYATWFNQWDYTYRFRHIDASCKAGILIPTAQKRNIRHVASIPFGGDGLWGGYISPRFEFELKEDWKVGLLLRLQKRFGAVQKQRLVVGKEPINFGMIEGDVFVDPGVTFMAAPFVAMDDFRAGIGVRAQFTVIKHQCDAIRDRRGDKSIPINTRPWLEKTEWMSEYATVHVYYDTKYAHPEWKVQPKFNIRWDLPLGLMSGYGYAKTNRVSLGATITF